MSKIGYYNRLHRTSREIAEIFIEESPHDYKGIVLVRKTSDGSQPTYEVRWYATLSDKPNFLNGAIFNVEELTTTKGDSK